MTDTTKIQVFITDTQGRKGYKVYSPEEYKQKNVAAWLDENYPHQYQVRTIEDVEDGSEIDESASYNVRVEKADGSYAEKEYSGSELAEKMSEFQKRFGDGKHKITTSKVQTYNTAKGPFAAEERARLLTEMAATREKLAEVDKIDMSGEMYNTGLTFKTSRDIDPGKDTVALRKQLEGLQSEYYNLEPVQDEFKRGAEEAREANERLAKLWREESGKINMAGEIYNPTPSISHGAEYDYNKTLSDAARRLNNETRKLYEAPSKYDGDPAIKKFFIGAGDRLTDADFWTMGLTEAADYFGLNQVFDKIQKLGGLENLTEEDIESNLTPFESEALGAFFRNMSAQAAREEDLALAYQSGMTAADSIGFMAQFALSGGATAAASKAMGNWIAKKIGKEVIEKAAKKKVLNLAGKAVKGAVETGVQTLLQPHTYANYQRNKYSLEAVSDNPEDGIRLVKNANEALRSYADSYIETLSEKSGTALGWPARWVGKKIGATAWMDALKRTKFGRVANAFFRSDVLNFMKAGGWNGYLGEMGEEFFGDALRTITHVDPEALKNAVQKDNLLIMATSFLPMTMLGGIGGVANYAAVRKEYDLDKAYFQETMRKFNIDESAIQHAIDVAESTHTETPEQLNAVLSPLVDEVVERGGNPTAVFLFARKAAQFQFYRAGDEVRKQMDRETELARLEAEYGGKMVDSEGNVKVATLPEGGTGIVVTSEGGESMVKKADGTIGFVSNTEEDIESIPLNDFLDRSIYARVKAEDDARVEQESAEKVAEAKQKVVPGAAFNNGTEESPMVAEVIEVVGDTANVQMADGSVKPMRISEVAQKMGTDMVVKTREEMEAEKAEALVRGRQIVDQFNSQKMRPVVLNTESGPVEATGIIARVDENGRVFAQVEVQGEEMEVPYEQITLVEAPSVTPEALSEGEAVETPTVAAPQTAAAPAGPVDFRGNPLPMRQNKNGEMVVDEGALWNNDPEAFAAYNDANPQRAVDTMTFLTAKLAELGKKKTEVEAALQNEYITTMDGDKIDAYKDDLSNINDRIAKVSGVIDKYNKAAEMALAQAEAKAQAEVEAAAAPKSAAAPAAETATNAAPEAPVQASESELRAKVEELQKKLGVPISVFTDVDSVDNAAAKAALKEKRIVTGWYDVKTGSVGLYLPNIKDANEITATYIHEVVAHKGVREALGKKGFESFLSEVWKGMSLKDQTEFLSYPGVKGWEDAADEYVAHHSESLDFEPSVWSRIADALKTALSFIGIDLTTTDDVVADALRQSYRNLKRGARQTQKENAKAEGKSAKFRVAAEQLEEMGVNVDEKTGDVRFSVRYVTTDEQKDKLTSLAKVTTGRNAEDIKRWIDSEQSVAALVLADQQYLDYDADPRYTAIKTNSDYPQGTVDFNNLCRKRLPFTEMYTRLQREWPNKVFNKYDLAVIRDVMSKDDLLVACGLCYVEDRRQLIGEVAEEFIGYLQNGFDAYINKTGNADAKRKNVEKFQQILAGDTYIPNIYELATLEGGNQLYESHPSVWKAFQAFNNARGQQSQNLFQGYAEYKREILSWTDAHVKKVNDNGGLRIFSYSDFEAHHLIDTIQIIMDCAARGVMVQGYTKVPAFARAVANTGIKLNRSLIPLGDTGIVDGQLAFDPVEGIDVNDPNFLEANDNVGNVLVGINDEQIRLAMADPRVHYIIPFHGKRKAGELRAKLNIGAWQLYDDYQIEKDAATGRAAKNGINIYTDILKGDITNDQQFVEAYLNLCKQRGITPKFPQFLNVDAQGEYVYTPGYHKFLVDFKLFDESGNILPQQPVVAEFDDNFNAQILNEYVEGEKESKGETMDETFKKIVKELGLEGETTAEGESTRFRSEPSDRVLSLFNQAKTGELSGKPISIGSLTKEGRAYLERISGIKLKQNVSFVLNPYDLNHIYNNHYGKNEKDTGNNIPLNDYDIRRLVDVIAFPTNVVYGNDKQGRKVFYFLSDTPSGAYNLMEVYADRHGNLTAKTYYKTKKGASQRVMELKSLLSTSETYSGATLSDAKIPILFDITSREDNTLFRESRTDEQREKLFADAKAEFGTTNNFKVAGYMLPDGSLLDFSEANNGGNPNQRSLDHREIEGLIMNEGTEYESRWMYLADFMNEGAIRLLPEYAGINLMKAPTKEQRQRLMDFIYKYNGEVILEIADERLNNIAYVEYDRRTSPARIMRDIDGYFNEGIVPQQDVRFRFIGEKGAANLDKAQEATTRLDNLAVARQMEEAGKDANAIKLATGWERGADKLWRYEVPDELRFDASGNVDYDRRHPDHVRYQELLHKSNAAAILDGEPLTEEEQKEFDDLSTIYRGSELHRSSRLKDYVDSPSLFEAYPELRNIEVELVDGGDGNYSPSANKIKIGRRGDVESVLVHEIQHAIQHIEGFAQGSSASYWARRDGTDTYMLPTGEYERMQNNLRIANQLPENITAREVRDLWRNATNVNDRLAYVEIMDGLSQGYPLSEVKDMFQRDLDEAREILENDFRDNESPYNKYLRTAGEVEARNVQRRREMSLEQRRKSLAAETEDVAREDQIILREGLAAEGGVSFQIGDNAATEALNAKQQKNGSQEVVEESEILFRISNNNRQTITGWLNKREDLTEEDKQSFLDYIEDFPAKNQLVYSKWFANGAIRLPEDAPKVEQAIKVATIAKVDPMRYRNPMEIIDAFADIEVKGKRINPDTVSTLSDKQVAGDTGIVTYLVEESEESRKNMREIINTHFGKDCSPWCLLQGDGDGKLTEKSADYWKHYSAYPKRVAFKNGKLLAFSANSNNRVLWWDKQDASHDGIPVIGKLSNDELGRSGVLEYSNTGEILSTNNIHRGDKKDGVYEEWASLDGPMMLHEERKDGNLNGLRETWYENGQKKDSASFKDGECEWTRTWYKNGQLKSSADYVDGKMEGTLTEWNEEGVMIRRSEFKKGQRHGLHETFHPDGQIDGREWYTYGERDGKSESYYPNGQLRTRRFYDKGERIGLSEGWYEDGQLTMRESYSDDKLDGQSLTWYENGQLMSKHEYDKGEIVGISEAWHRNGQLLSRSEYVNGQLNGIRREWDENGQLVEEAEFKDGLYDGVVQRWDDEGHLESRQEFKDNSFDGVSEEFYPSGQMKSRINYKQDNYDGLYEEWYENGQMKKQANYKNNSLNGWYAEWYENGQMKISADYARNELDGLYEEWYENGQKRIRATYKDGNTNGLLTKWNEQGEVTFEAVYDNGLKVQDEALFREVEITPEVRQEMNRIGAVALVNGTYLKAPNGKDTNLTDDQWALVRTENFKKWFGLWESDPENASKVVDENGEPKVVYHGTPHEFWEFRYNHIESGNELGGGYYFGTQDLAEMYTRPNADNRHIVDRMIDRFFKENPDKSAGNSEDFAEAEKWAEQEAFKNARLMPVFLNIRKPFVANNENDFADAFRGFDTVGQALWYEGYDGVIDNSFYKRHKEDFENEISEDTVQYFLTNPANVKSATENNGEYRPEKMWQDNDIRFRESDFGEVYEQFRGKPKEAVAFLMEKKSGEAVGALNHNDVGEISIVYGNDKAGLKKIAEKHPEVLDILQDILDESAVIQQSENRIKLESDRYFTVISKDYLGKPRSPWLLTAFEKKNSALDNTMDTEETSKGSKQNDTATLQDTVSESKDSDNLDNSNTSEEKTLHREVFGGNSGNTGEFSGANEDIRFRSREEAKQLLQQMQDNAELLVPMQLTEELWKNKIDGKIFSTPVGDVKLGPNQYYKNISKGREREFGMLLPTIERPDLIFEEKDPEEEAERQTAYVFVKTFYDENGERHINYASVSIQKEGMEVVKSSHRLRDNQVLNKIEKEQMLWNRFASDSSSSVQNSSTDQSNALSESKDSDNLDNSNSSEDTTYYREVTDPATLEKLNSEPTIKVYRAMQLIDGKLYPPMSAREKVQTTTKSGKVVNRWKLRAPIELGRWEEAEERPEMAREDGTFVLDKGNGSTVPAAYNPYFHTSRTPLNDQFASAQSRPNLVTVEVEVPESELTSDYKAEKAKDSVGEKEWKAGVVQGKLSGTRKVILSRWDKPVRIVPDSEVADEIVKMFEGKDIVMPSNVVTPSLRAELEERGVPFIETDNNGNPVTRFRDGGVLSAYNAADFRRSERAKREMAQSTAELMGMNTEFITRDDLAVNLGLIKGYAQGDTMYIAADNCNDSDDAVSVVLSEAAKSGLERVLGDRYTTFLKSAYAAIPEEKKMGVAESAVGQGLNLPKAVEEYIAEVAEDSSRDEEFEMLSGLLREGLAARGIETVPADNVLRWMLWNAPEQNRQDDLMGVVKSASAAHRFGVSTAAQQARGEVEDLVRFREIRDHISAADIYNSAVTTWVNRVREVDTDMYQSVNVLMDAIEKATGRKAEGFEDIRTALVQQSSKGLRMSQDWEKKYFEPLRKVVEDICNEYGVSVADIERYVMTKHGLERNEVFAKRDAKEFHQAVYNKTVASIADDKTLTDDQKEALKEKAKKKLDAALQRVENETDAKYKELRKNDYGGLVGLYSKYTETVTRGEDETQESYNKRLLAARKPRFVTADGKPDVEETEKEAYLDAQEFQNKIGGFGDGSLARTLWDRINAANKATLKIQQDAGLISRAQYESISKMFEYYVPLRGFSDTTAEDMYDYYTASFSGDYTQPLKRASGRTTVAESPFGYIGAMASSAIASAEKNRAKLALYYFIQNRPDQDLAQVTDTWYEADVEREADGSVKKDANGTPVYKLDADGKKIFRPAFPDPADLRGKTAEEIKQVFEDFEKQMKQKQMWSLAFKRTGKQKIDYVIHADKSQLDEHIISVKVLGQDKKIYINGNPRAAQAINQVFNLDANAGKVREWLAKVLRYMSAMNTSYDPTFAVGNFERDILYALMSISAKEDKMYNSRFAANIGKAFKVFSLKLKDKNGTLGSSHVEDLYKEFVEHGGITGYTVIKGNEEWEKQMGKFSADESKFKKAVEGVLDGLQYIGESLEQVTRFAVFMTSREMGRDIRTSIANAKDVTVNFNRKGSGTGLTWEETEKLTTKDGKPLNKAERFAVMAYTNASGFARSSIMFYNASMQALNNTINLYKTNPAKMGVYTAMFFAFGAINAVIGGLLKGDDDDKGSYLDIPEYERRSNLMIGAGDIYFKWSLPQEMRVFYALGDMIVNKTMGREPDRETLGAWMGDIANLFLELLPVNPAAGASSFVPSALAPIYEAGLPLGLDDMVGIYGTNKDFTGSPIYRDFKYLSEEEQKMMPKYQKAYSGTAPIYMWICKTLNDLSGGDQVKAGVINLNPAVMQHYVEGYTGGVGRVVNQTINLLSSPFQVKNVPFLSRVLTNLDDKNRNSHTSRLFYYYKNEAELAETIVRKYLKAGETEKAQKEMESEQYKWLQIYQQYEGYEKMYQQLLKDTTDEAERKRLMKEQDAYREEMIEEIAKLR